MNSIQRAVLSMIRCALWDMPFECDKEVTALDLYNEACRYEIAGILSTKLDCFCKEDDDVRAKWSNKVFNDYQKNGRILSELVSLRRILEKENIKPIVLKGMASAYYYSNPLLRQMGDIDFMILPNQLERCFNALEKNGFIKGLDIPRHVHYSKNNIEYECHRYFSNNKSSIDTIEDQLLFDGCQSCITRSVEGKQFYVLPDCEYGIVLLEHLKHHLIDGVGFRQIMDWVVYANKVLNDDTWENEFKKKVEICHLDCLAKAITRTAQLYLGLNTKNIHWCLDVDESLCLRFIELIFSCNNFGFIEENNKDIHMVGNIARTGFFKQLHLSSLSHMPIAKKVIILRPIAWVKQLLRWGSKSLLIKNKKSILSMKEWNKQKELLRQLGVDENV